MRRRRARFSGGGDSQVDMAPLIDMVFLLLIFYIVTTSFVKESGVPIDKPESDRAQALDGSFVAVAVTAQGQVFVDGQRIAMEDLATLRRVIEHHRSKRVVVQADGQATTQTLLAVMDACHAAGAKQVDVAALPR